MSSWSWFSFWAGTGTAGLALSVIGRLERRSLEKMITEKVCKEFADGMRKEGVTTLVIEKTGKGVSK